MYPNIQKFMMDHSRKIKGLPFRPIIQVWMESPGMSPSLSVIDKHVGDLPNKGKTRKLNQWFLAGDENFNAITAERYIFAYLREKNDHVIENADKQGVDGYINDQDGAIGLEITTLNENIIDWIFSERIQEYLRDHDNQNLINGIELYYSAQSIQKEFQAKKIYDYIEQVGQAILSNDEVSLKKLDISLTFHDRGFISYHNTDEDESVYRWFTCITEGIFNKLRDKSKVMQLNKQKRNIIFVGLNHTHAADGYFPSLFEYLVEGGGLSYRTQVRALEDYWKINLPNLPNTIGICYYFYSLCTETPFYPLKIFWRNEGERIAINI